MAIIQKVKELILRKEFWAACPVVRRRRWYGVVFGFGLAGALWGWDLYRFREVIPGFSTPFIIDFGVISLGVLSGLALTIFSRDIKKMLKVVILGIVVWVVAFFTAAIFSYSSLGMIGAGMLSTSFLLVLSPLSFLPFDFLKEVDLFSLMGLNPSLTISHFWLGFLISGFIISLYYALILKKKIKPLIINGSLSFGLASIFSPIIGNLIGNSLFNSLLLAYLITFILISTIFGLFLAKAIYKQENE